jgi:hypothetical protein
MQPASDDFKKWLDGLLPTLRGMAQETLNIDKQMIPHLLVCSYKSEILMMPVTLSTVEEKNMVAGLHQHLAEKAGIIAGVIFVTETWMLEIDKDKDPEEYARKSRSKEGIEHEPNKTEAVMWNAIRGEMQLMAFAKITRSGNSVTLEPTTILDAAKSGAEGRMVVGSDEKPS